MGGKRNKKKAKKNMSEATVAKIARQQAYKMIPKKINWTEGIDYGPGFVNNAAPWTMISPAYLSVGDNVNYERESDSVFIEKCTGFFNVSFSTACTHRVEIRELVGFYKGDSTGSAKNISDFSAIKLSSDLPNKISNWDRDNYFITHDKHYDLMPHQIYNNADSGGDNQATGVWKSKQIRLGQYLYRKYRYSNGNTGQGSGGPDGVEGTVSGSNNYNPIGWKPFIALQVRCPEQDFTGATGSNPGPYIDYKFKTLFKDLK